MPPIIYSFTRRNNGPGNIVYAEYVNELQEAVEEISARSGGGDASTNTATSVDSEIALFSSTTGKLLKRATGSGIAKLASGVLSVVTAPSGTIVGDTDAQTLTNKTLTTPTIASLTNAQHNHTNAAGGGQITDAALSSAVSIAKGGTGQTTQGAAINALLPTQTSNAGKHLVTDASNPSWATIDGQLPKIVTGGTRYWTSRQLANGGSGAMNFIPSTTICVPIAITTPCTLDRMGCKVTTAAGTTVQISLYDNDGTYGPGTRLANGTVSPATTGIKLVTISVAIPRPQIVWVALNADSNTTQFEAVINGTSFILGIDASTGDYSGMVKTADGAGSTNPSPFNGSAFWNGGSNQIPVMYLRA